MEGRIPVRRSRGDGWELRKEATRRMGTRSGAVIRLGDPVRVRVDLVDAPRGRVDLLPAWEMGSDGAAETRGGAGSRSTSARGGAGSRSTPARGDQRGLRRG